MESAPPPNGKVKRLCDGQRIQKNGEIRCLFELEHHTPRASISQEGWSSSQYHEV
jgi:hypothetical protein